MTTQEFQSQIIDTCKQQEACTDQFKLLLSVKDRPALFLQVLRNNHRWCVDNEIYSPDLLLQLDAELLLRGGYATQQTKPVSFEPVEVGDNVWAPFNHGGSLDNINGSYHSFDEALTLDYGEGLRQPAMIEHCALASAPNMFGIYAGTFGRMFEGSDGRLFLPASGYRYYNSGAFYRVGVHGYAWSSSVVDYRSGFFLQVNESAGVYPRAGYYRANGFPVRCVGVS